jgi:hypothetical protein
MMRLHHGLLAALMIFGCDGGGNPSDDAGQDTQEDAVDTLQDTAPDVPEETGCGSDADCDDSDPCTSDVCDTSTGDCSHGDVDEDSDGYLAAEVDGTDCGGTDCDDTDADIHPGAIPNCDGEDTDCDTLIDNDEDSDGFVAEACDGDDCNDGDASIFPGADPVECSEADHDCNDEPDEDNDGDGEISDACTGGTDCDDGDVTVRSGTAEMNCDGKDNDCNGEMSTFEDVDQDGWANEMCSAVGAEFDCDDHDWDIYPGATEACDDIDDDCDGSWADGGADDDGDTVLDDTCGGADCNDDDPDTYPGSLMIDCSTADHDCNGVEDHDNDADGEDRAACSGTDCDDADPAINAAATEICLDGVDNDCDGVLDGPMLLTTELTVSGAQNSSASLVWSGSEYGVVWTMGGNDIRFNRVSSSGTLVGSEVDVDGQAPSTGEPRMVWTDAGYHMVWTLWDGSPSIYYAMLDGNGAKTRSNVEIITEISTPVEMGFSGSELALLWKPGAGSGIGHFARLATSDGHVIGSSLTIDSVPVAYDGSSIQWTGSQWGVAMEYANMYFESIYMQRITGAGSAIGSAVMLTGYYGPTGLSSLQPSIAWNGSEYGMAFTDRRPAGGYTDVFFMRVGADASMPAGDVNLTGTFPDSNGPSIVWNGSEYGVSWCENVSGNYYVYFTVLDTDGARRISDIQISVTPFLYTTRSRMVWSGSEFGIVWNTPLYGPGGPVVFSRIGYCE